MRIRVMLGDMAAMVGSALRGSLSECDDIQLVAGGTSARTPYDEVDVLVLHRPEIHSCGEMLKALVEAAPIGVLAIDGSGETGSVYRLDRETRCFVGGGEGLAEAIRAAAGAR